MLAVKALLAILNRRLPRRENPLMPVALSYVVFVLVLALLGLTTYILFVH